MCCIADGDFAETAGSDLHMTPRSCDELQFVHRELSVCAVLQRETLLKQLEVNAQDMLSTTEELAIHEESEEQNYDV